jgi:hypothetical protein
MIPSISLPSSSLSIASDQPANALQGNTLKLVTPAWRTDDGFLLTDVSKVRFGLYEPNSLPVWVSDGVEAVPFGGFALDYTFAAPGDWVVFAEYSDTGVTRTVERALTITGSVLLGGAEAPDGGTPTIWLDAKVAVEARLGAEAARDDVDDFRAEVAAKHSDVLTKAAETARARRCFPTRRQSNRPVSRSRWKSRT